MPALQLAASSSLQLAADSYIYRILPTGHGLSVLASDDTVRILNPDTLQQKPDGELRGVNDSVTCLESYAESAMTESSTTIVTAGRDGFIRFWDLRTSQMTMETKVKTERQLKQSLSSLVTNAAKHYLVAGSELEGRDGPGDAPIFVWDVRNLRDAQHVYTECHTDTVSELKFHSSHPSLLLSASTDSLINLIDITNADEDESIQQVVNNRSAVHHSGFLDDNTFYGLGTDETLAFYPVEISDADDSHHQSKSFGDLRPRLSVEYIVNILHGQSGHWIVGGSHSLQRLQIFPIQKQSAEPLQMPWDLAEGLESLLIETAHGEDIVRDVYMTAGEEPIVYTCGEDGKVKAWTSRMSEGSKIAQETASRTRKSTNQSKTQERRYRPY